MKIKEQKMADFAKTLTPCIDAARTEAIKHKIAELHTEFALLAELTESANTFEEIAQRFVDKGLVDTYQPDDAFRSLCMAGEDLIVGVGDLLFMPDRSELFQLPAGVEPERSKPLQAFLAREGKQ
jgi:hypothetical protein